MEFADFSSLDIWVGYDEPHTTLGSVIFLVFDSEEVFDRFLFVSERGVCDSTQSEFLIPVKDSSTEVNCLVGGGFSEFNNFVQCFEVGDLAFRFERLKI